MIRRNRQNSHLLKTRSLFLIMLTLAGLAGIIASGGGGGNGDNGAAGIAAGSFVGFTRCYDCHADDNIYTQRHKVFGDTTGGDNSPDSGGWLAGPHANLADINSSTGDHPDYLEIQGCLTVCHDQLADGRLIADYFDQTGNTAFGLVDRPVTACESCHGTGGNHNGSGPIPYPAPDAGRCGQCHNDGFSLINHPDHPESAAIYENYLASPHARSINSHNYVSGSTTDVRNHCSRCHTDEGARAYITVVNGTEGRTDLVAALGDRLNIEDANVVQCRTCHDGHNPDYLLGNKATGLPEAWSREFKTCTACHQLLKDDDTLQTEAYHDPAVNKYGALEEIITDTHLPDYPETSYQNGNAKIEGYAIDPANERACRDCHDVHAADVSINVEWARSGHAGGILEAKEAAAAATEADGGDADALLAAVRAAGADGEETPWPHYDWDAGNRQACQRCHSATGAKNYLTDPENYDPADNDFSHLAGWSKAGDGTVTSSHQNELLYCWACHSNNSGALRQPGPITADYSGAAHTYPDILGSNVCMSCHTGRESGESIKNSTADFTNRSFINSHYLSAGGTVFTQTGYEYDVDGDPLTDDYANVAYYKHDKIGLGVLADLAAFEAANGTNGPCVGCHLSSPESHLFLPITKDENGLITTITSTLCGNCHKDNHALTVEELIEQEEGLAAALEALRERLSASGYNYSSNYPYFGNKNWTLAGDPTGKHDMGAAFNYNLLVHDPGAYAHNRFYAKRLIFDAIDWLDNNTMDGAIDLSGYEAAAAYLKSSAPKEAVTRP